jgi:hypothetical protein
MNDFGSSSADILDIVTLGSLEVLSFVKDGLSSPGQRGGAKLYFIILKNYELCRLWHSK